MHVVLVNPEYPPSRGTGHGGIATFTYALANALSAAGCKVTVLLKDGSVPDPLPSDVAVHAFAHKPGNSFTRFLDRFRNGDIVWETGYSVAARDLVVRLHKDTPVDVVEIPEYNGLAVSFGGRLPFPVVIHFHTPSLVVDQVNQTVVTAHRRQWYSFERLAVGKASGYKCPSNALRAVAARLFDIPPHQMTVVRNPVDTRDFDRILRPRAVSDRIDLLFAGRLERRKGADIMLRTGQRLLALDQRIHITFAGETDIAQAVNYRQAIERSLSEAQRGRVWFIGPVRHDAMPLLYRRSSIFLFPSLFENAPFALYEAMAAGLPIVAANVDGVNEIIRHRSNGLLFDAGTPEGLVSCVEELLRDPVLASACAARARADVETECRPASIAATTIAFYEQTCARHRRPHGGRTIVPS